uniref:Uncharacterized protein n=1 Tax=Glossina pallidipes TaxID=7398 RepID=A0A1A9ZK05_GLOPL
MKCKGSRHSLLDNIACNNWSKTVFGTMRFSSFVCPTKTTPTLIHSNDSLTAGSALDLAFQWNVSKVGHNSPNMRNKLDLPQPFGPQTNTFIPDLQIKNEIGKHKGKQKFVIIYLTSNVNSLTSTSPLGVTNGTFSKRMILSWNIISPWPGLNSFCEFLMLFNMNLKQKGQASKLLPAKRVISRPANTRRPTASANLINILPDV